MRKDSIIVNQKIRWITVRTVYRLTDEEIAVVEGSK